MLYSLMILREIMFDTDSYPDSKVRGANMRPIWGRQDPDGPHIGQMNLVIRVYLIKT